MYRQTFYFNNNATLENVITPQTIYDENKGYGFVDLDNIPGKTKSEQSLYCGGWNIRNFAQNDWKNNFTATDDSIKLINSRFVMIFKFLVPEDGSYRISIESIAGNEGISNMAVFCGRRNLVEQNINVKPNATYRKSFFTYVSPYIPAMTSIPCKEKAIYISITGKHAQISKITIEKQPTTTIFIAGDSTLTDQNALFPYYPYGSCAGWAQRLLQFFPNIAVNNQAHSGMTTNCFRDDGHWNILYNHICEGDIVILQFGHNDQKRRNLSAFNGYAANLRWYIKEIQQKKAYPILVSPISRIPFEENGSMHSLLNNYAEACKMVANEYQIPFIDLHTFTFNKWCELGVEASHDYFMKGDITHTNDYGADLIANMVISEIKRQSIYSLSNIDKDVILEFDTKDVPIEASSGTNSTIEIPYVDIDGISQYSDMVKALNFGLLDPCVMHLHPDKTIPRAQFLMVFFKALRISGKRPYTGEFCDIAKYEWDSAYVQTCIEENLIDLSTTPNRRFRPDNPLTQEEYANFLVRGLQADKSYRNLSLAETFYTAKNLGFIKENVFPKDYIKRADCYAGLVKLMNLLNTTFKSLPADTEIHPVG